MAYWMSGKDFRRYGSFIQKDLVICTNLYISFCSDYQQLYVCNENPGMGGYLERIPGLKIIQL